MKKGAQAADPVNRCYTRTLIAAAQGATVSPLVIAEFPHEVNPAREIVYPSAIAPPQLLEQLPLHTYRELSAISPQDTPLAPLSLWLQPMQAGIGSSIARAAYLAKKMQGDPAAIHPGAKGSDLSIELQVRGQRRQVSLAEVQILRALQLAEEAEGVGEVFYSDLVSEKTAGAIAEIWKKSVPREEKSRAPALSYEEYFAASPLLRFFPQAPQEAIAGVDAEGNFLTEISAPAGHGFFGFRALLAAVLPELRPTAKFSLLGVISNGEDLSPKPLGALTRWMLAQQVPIAMITTTKTPVDCKGGQIALRAPAHEGQCIEATIVELAQAEQVGQSELFLHLGLRPGDQPAYFNTNTVVLNYAALSPLLQVLYAEIGEEEFCRIIAPTVIKNKKEHVDARGQVSAYTQIEGALGSVMLNLDAYWRRRFGRGLVRFINVEVEDRLEFFAPIKSSFDFYQLFYSDCCRFDGETLRFKAQPAALLPLCYFADAAYADVDFVLEAFRGCKIAQLKKLHVEGKVLFTDCSVQGSVQINNHTGQPIALREVAALGEFYRAGRLVLKDIAILFTSQQEEPLIISRHRTRGLAWQAEA